MSWKKILKMPPTDDPEEWREQIFQDVYGTLYTYNNMNELLEGSDSMHIALELVGHMKGLDILGL
jgi:hypothetical protein